MYPFPSTHTYTLTHPHHTHTPSPHTHLTTHPHSFIQAAGAETYGAEGLGVYMEPVWFALKKEVEKEKELFYVCPECTTILLPLADLPIC